MLLDRLNLSINKAVQKNAYEILSCHISLLLSGQETGCEIMGIHCSAYDGRAGWRRMPLVFELVAEHLKRSLLF